MMWGIIVVIFIIVCLGIVTVARPHRGTPPACLSGKKAYRIACIGDSITFGWDPSDSARTWEEYLEEKLGKDFQVLNYGLRGCTLQNEGDLPYSGDRLFSISQNIHADCYLIMLGTNDSKAKNWNAERFYDEYAAFVKCYRSLANAPLICLMVPPCSFPMENGQMAAGVQTKIVKNEIRPFILSYAKEHKIPCFDLYEFTLGHPEWFKDGLHPNEEGRKMIGGYIYARLCEQGIITSKSNVKFMSS